MRGGVHVRLRCRGGLARRGSDQRRPARRVVAMHVRREVGCSARPGIVGAARHQGHVLCTGARRGTSPRTHRGDPRRGTRACAPRIHTHAAFQAHSRRGTHRAREWTRGPAIVQFRRRRLSIAVVGLQRETPRSCSKSWGSTTPPTSWTTPSPTGERGAAWLRFRCNGSWPTPRTSGSTGRSRFAPPMIVRFDLGGRVPRLPPAGRVVRPGVSSAGHGASVPVGDAGRVPYLREVARRRVDRDLPRDRRHGSLTLMGGTSANAEHRRHCLVMHITPFL